MSPLVDLKNPVGRVGVLGLRRRKDNIARRGSGRAIPERLAAPSGRTPEPGMPRGGPGFSPSVSCLFGPLLKIFVCKVTHWSLPCTAALKYHK